MNIPLFSDIPVKKSVPVSLVEHQLHWNGLQTLLNKKTFQKLSICVSDVQYFIMTVEWWIWWIKSKILVPQRHSHSDIICYCSAPSTRVAIGNILSAVSKRYVHIACCLAAIQLLQMPWLPFLIQSHRNLLVWKFSIVNTLAWIIANKRSTISVHQVHTQSGLLAGCGCMAGLKSDRDINRLLVLFVLHGQYTWLIMWYRNPVIFC